MSLLSHESLRKSLRSLRLSCLQEGVPLGALNAIPWGRAQSTGLKGLRRGWRRRSRSPTVLFLSSLFLPWPRAAVHVFMVGAGLHRQALCPLPYPTPRSSYPSGRPTPSASLAACISANLQKCFAAGERRKHLPGISPSV